MIHPTAVVHPEAKIHPSVRVGPYAVIDSGVSLAENCEVGPHAHLTGRLDVAKDNRFHTGCVIGDAPQDLKYDGAATEVRIGEGNVFREHVTVHRSNSLDEPTRIGSQNFFMAHSHVGHNCQIQNRVILANGALLGGHVSVADRAFISGYCMVHQFVRIGTLALMQGRAGVSKDVPPFSIAAGINRICGLNVVGLRRAGYGVEDRLLLKRLYREIFRSSLPIQAAASRAHAEHHGPLVDELVRFVMNSRRGVCGHSGRASSDSNESEADPAAT